MLQIVASLLLYMEEEDVFWLTCTIIEDMLPASYFSNSLLGVQADQKVLVQLISNYLPELDQTFKHHDVGMVLEFMFVMLLLLLLLQLLEFIHCYMLI